MILKPITIKTKVVAQPKYDGERLLLHFDKGNFYATSRRHSSKTGRFNESQENLPTFIDNNKLNLNYTVLDGEVYSKDWSTSSGIMRSLPERSLELQKENQIRFAAFDCLFYDGQDIRDRPYSERLQYAYEVIEMIQLEHIHMLESVHVDSVEHAYEIMDEYISQGFEGSCIKPLNKSYYDKHATLKLKKFEHVDVVVYGTVQGKGKYENTVGALSIGYYDEVKDEIVHISQVAPGTDAERDMWRDNWEDMKMSVIEVKCQEITKKSLRHPVLIRIRHDKDYKMVTKDTIFKEED